MSDVISAVEGLHFVTSPPDVLSAKGWDEIQALRESFYEGEFSPASAENAAGFVALTDEVKWNNLNNSSLRGHFARHRVVAAYDAHEVLQGYVYGVNNASADHTGTLGVIEALAKLHVPLPPLLERRYLKLHEIVGPNDVVMGAMTAVLLDSYSPRQPVTSYPYTEERLLAERLRAWGLQIDPDVPPEPIEEAFGPGSSTTEQTRYVARRAGSVVANITSLYPEAVKYAKERQHHDSGISLDFPSNPRGYSYE